MPAAGRANAVPCTIVAADRERRIGPTRVPIGTTSALKRRRWRAVRWFTYRGCAVDGHDQRSCFEFEKEVCSMRSRSTRVLVLASVMFGALATASAWADDCPVGCAAQNKADLQAARTTMLACQADCRQNAAPTDRGTCLRGCTDVFQAAKDAARTDHAECITSCTEPTPDASTGGAAAPTTPCRGTCGQDLSTCARGVVSAAKTCIRSCQAASDRVACLEACAAAAETQAATCADDFATCTGACPVPTPPAPPVPTPGPTFVPPPACGPVDGAACGGTCPNPGEACRSVSGSCTCVANP